MLWNDGVAHGACGILNEGETDSAALGSHLVVFGEDVGVATLDCASAHCSEARHFGVELCLDSTVLFRVVVEFGLELVNKNLESIGFLLGGWQEFPEFEKAGVNVAGTRLQVFDFSVNRLRVFCIVNAAGIKASRFGFHFLRDFLGF